MLPRFIALNSGTSPVWYGGLVRWLQSGPYGNPHPISICRSVNYPYLMLSTTNMGNYIARKTGLQSVTDSPQSAKSRHINQALKLEAEASLYSTYDAMVMRTTFPSIPVLKCLDLTIGSIPCAAPQASASQSPVGDLRRVASTGFFDSLMSPRAGAAKITLRSYLMKPALFGSSALSPKELLP